MPDAIRIRDYDDTDFLSVMSIFQRAVREVASRDYGPQQIAVWSTARSGEWRKRRLTRPTWIAEIDGRAAGFTDLEPGGHLDMMYVSPDFQGIGVATALLEQVELQARQWRLRRIHTEASITGRPFFHRRGFMPIAEQTILVDGVALTNTRMEKWLA
jgi:putative acetyltransferase